MTIRAVIAEDEPISRGRLRQLVHNIPEFEVVGECRNGRETIDAVLLQKPDLLFLDVQMPDIDGFGVLRALESGPIPTVIFTTAFDKYAVSAFEHHALDYLLKPFDEERFQKAIIRARSHILRGKAEAAGQIHSFLEDPEVSRRAKQLIIKSGGRLLFLRMDDIDWIESAANYVRIHAGSHTYPFRTAINKLEDRLDKERFVRIHRSILINPDRIEELEPCGNSEFLVKLSTGKVLPMSRGYRKSFERFLKEKGDIRNLTGS